MQTPRPGWSARPRGILDKLTQWQAFGSVRSISFWCVITRWIDHSRILEQLHNFFSLLLSLILCLAFSFLVLFWIGSGTEHRSHTLNTLPFHYLALILLCKCNKIMSWWGRQMAANVKMVKGIRCKIEKFMMDWIENNKQPIVKGRG